MSEQNCHNACALTSREIQVLRFVGRGWNNKQIAERFGVQESTVRCNYIDMLHSKLNIRNRVQLALYAHCHGYVAIDEIDYGVTVETVRAFLR